MNIVLSCLALALGLALSLSLLGCCSLQLVDSICSHSTPPSYWQVNVTQVDTTSPEKWRDISVVIDMIVPQLPECDLRRYVTDRLTVCHNWMIEQRLTHWLTNKYHCEDDWMNGQLWRKEGRKREVQESSHRIEDDEEWRVVLRQLE